MFIAVPASRLGGDTVLPRDLSSAVGLTSLTFSPTHGLCDDECACYSQRRGIYQRLEC